MDSSVDPNCPDETLLPCSLRIGIIPAGQKHKYDSWNQKYFFYSLIFGCKLNYPQLGCWSTSMITVGHR